MASVEVEIASRRYTVACRDGEEAHLRAVAAIVDQKAQDAAGALGNLSESRQLLYASLLLADELKERRSGANPEVAPAAAQPGEAPEEDDYAVEMLERLAERLERMAQRLEREAEAS